jgi:hypothetical protein
MFIVNGYRVGDRDTIAPGYVGGGLSATTRDRIVKTAAARIAARHRFDNGPATVKVVAIDRGAAARKAWITRRARQVAA